MNLSRPGLPLNEERRKHDTNMGLVFAVCLDSGEQALVLVSENPGPRQVQLKLKNLRLSR
jgi:hypothetical protein